MIKKILIGFIRFYQWGISPYFSPCCRFQPTCSQYAIEAIRYHGVFKGTFLAIKRLSRCHPLGSSGFDPVPHSPLSETCHGTKKQQS